MALCVADALVCAFAAALAVGGKLPYELLQLWLAQMVLHAHDLHPRLIALHLAYRFSDANIPRVRGGGGGVININNLYIILLWNFCCHFWRFCLQ